MANKNHAFVIGNLTHDPFFDYLDGAYSPVPFMRLYLAVDRHPPHKQGTDFLQVVAYDLRALHDHAFLRKGSEIAVEGWLRTRRVGGNGRGSHTLVELVAEEITFLRNIDWEAGKSHWRQVQAEMGDELAALQKRKFEFSPVEAAAT